MAIARKYENTAVSDIDAREANDPRISLSRKQCETEGNWGPSAQIAKENRGCFNRYLDGSSVRITAKSFYAHLRNLANAPPRKVRQPLTRFKPRRRERTPQELAALQRVSERHVEEGQKRREAKIADRV